MRWSLKKKKQRIREEIPVSRIRAVLRRLWFFYSPVRREALKRAKDSCEICLKKAEKLQVHHVCKLGKPEDWDFWIKQLFSGRQIAICEKCHKSITKEERENERKR